MIRQAYKNPSVADEAFDLAIAAAGGIALGVAAMYMLDPVAGGKRRSIIRGKMTRSVKRSGTAIRKTGEYLAGQARGMAAETRGRFRQEDVSDRKLTARVRSAIGRAVSHPAAIDVQADQGVVTLRGPVLEEELNSLLRTVGRVRGVERVENQLDVHSTADISALQGAGRQGSRWMRENWSPSTRMFAMMTGAGLGICGVIRGGPMGLLLSAAGLGALTRGLTNLPARRLVGVGAGRRAIDVQKTINVQAPLDTVFLFFATYENFPYFMSNVLDVTDSGSGRSHWRVKGPAGVPVEWDADLTSFEPNQVLAWKSVEGSTVANSGIIHFEANPDGGTRVDIKLSYNPPAGAIGHAIAKVFGADPKSEMDQDLMRVKTLLETGQPAHDAAKG